MAIEWDLFGRYIEEVKSVSGDFAEFGVHRGDHFMRFLAKGIEQGRTSYAFDSFRGMPEPGEHDPGYPLGKFDVGGPGALMRRLKNFPDDSYKLIVGYIPGILEEIPDDVQFAFSYVDIDHHATTKALLDWLIKRVPVGGIIVCDDFFPQHNKLATRGIKEFVSECDVIEMVELWDRKVVFRRF